MPTGEVLNDVTGVRPLRAYWPWLLVIALLSTLPYWRSLGLPPIEDDYLQIWLGQIYGAPSQWGALLADPLYRCRATSIVLTRLTEELFGNTQFVFNLQSVILHAINAVLVAALGRWRVIGYKISIPAAFFWGLSERHHEAVIWYSALPEQLVFTFVLLATICWLEWWESGSKRAYAGACLAYGLALASKESGVVFCGLALLPLLADWRPWRRMAWAVAPFGAAAAGYFLLNYLAKANHLHWNDGTFRLGWHFIPVMLNSTVRVFWIWGLAGFVLLYFLRERVSRGVLLMGLAWILICLLPYAFIEYMPRVPSRHVYLAMAGRALILAVALQAVSQYRRWAAIGAFAFLLSNTGYVTLYKHGQFVARAQVMEDFLEKARQTPAEAYAVECFPRAPELAPLALQQRLGVDPKKVSARRDGDCTELTVKPADPTRPAVVLH